MAKNGEITPHIYQLFEVVLKDGVLANAAESMANSQTEMRLGWEENKQNDTSLLSAVT